MDKEEESSCSHQVYIDQSDSNTIGKNWLGTPFDETTYEETSVRKSYLGSISQMIDYNIGIHNKLSMDDGNTWHTDVSFGDLLAMATIGKVGINSDGVDTQQYGQVDYGPCLSDLNLPPRTVIESYVSTGLSLGPVTPNQDRRAEQHKQVEISESQESIGSKFRKVKTQVSAFNQIYTRMSNANNRPSGSNDAQLQQRALAEYQRTTLKPFAYLDIWERLRKSSRFHLVVDFDAMATRGQPTAKRSKTSSTADPQSQGSDGRVHIDPNSTEEHESRYIRPIGRDSTKKSTSSGLSRRIDYTEVFEKVTTKLDGLMESSNKRVELGERKLLLKEKKKKRAELKMLATDYSYLDEPERTIMEDMKKEIREKYYGN